MKNRGARLLLWITLGMLVVAGVLAPSGVEAQQSRSVDAELFEDLGADRLDGFDRELFGPDDKQGRVGELPGEGDSDLAQRLRRELAAAAVAEEDYPLLVVGRRMREVEGLIAQNDSGLATQMLQKQIIADLDELIRQAQKQGGGQPKPGGKQGQRRPSDSPPGPPRPKKGSGGSKQPGPSEAGKNDQANPGRAPHRRAELGQIQEMIRQLWGQLPQHQREQMVQPRFEEFLPKYELLIEEYFRRLTEETESTNGRMNDQR